MTELTKIHRSELEAALVDMAKTQERFRRSIANIVREFEDEGDRVYLGSTNDAEDLRDLDEQLTDTLNWLECPWMHGTDLWADLKALRETKADLLAALEVFAAVAEHDIGDDEVDSDLFRPMTAKHARAKLITVGDLRAARAAILKARGEGL